MQFRVRLLGRRVVDLGVVGAMAVFAAACDDSCPPGTTLEGKYCKTMSAGASSNAGSSSSGSQIGAAMGPSAAGTIGVLAGGGSAGPAAGMSAVTAGTASITTAAVAGQGAPMMSTTAGAGAAMSTIGGTGGGTGVSLPVPANCSPASEQCDNRDNDCDGKVDEAVTRSCGPASVGVCKAGTEQCVAGNWSGVCAGAVGPSVEVCDASQLDENCDGVQNERCSCSVGATRMCGRSQGICKPGMQSCISGQWDDVCAEKTDPTGPEICDGALDEDCDGIVDNGCVCRNGQTENCDAGQGVCSAGTKTCSAGQWGACVSNIGKTAETCDGLDNDCDGVPDNNACSGGLTCINKKCVECLDSSDCHSGNPCRTDTCENGACALGTPVAAHASCNTLFGAGVCDGDGRCSPCVDNSDCKSYQACNPVSGCSARPALQVTSFELGRFTIALAQGYKLSVLARYDPNNRYGLDAKVTVDGIEKCAVNKSASTCSIPSSGQRRVVVITGAALPCDMAGPTVVSDSHVELPFEDYDDVNDRGPCQDPTVVLDASP